MGFLAETKLGPKPGRWNLYLDRALLAPKEAESILQAPQHRDIASIPAVNYPALSAEGSRRVRVPHCKPLLHWVM